MNVLKALIAVTTMRLASTFKEITPAIAALDSQAMDLYALVSSFSVFLISSLQTSTNILTIDHTYTSITLYS